MVRWTRSARIPLGKFAQSIQWAKEIAEWLNKKYNLQIKVFIDYFGELGTIHWTVDYESLADLEKIYSQLSVDQEYWQKANQGAELLVEGTVIDNVMRVI